MRHFGMLLLYSHLRNHTASN